MRKILPVHIYLVFLALGWTHSCTKKADEPQPSAYSVTTLDVTDITANSAKSGGSGSTSPGTITGRGICWNTSPAPTTDNNKTANGSGSGDFTSSLSGLTAGTVYYVRAYANTYNGIVYGNEVSFTTGIAPPIVTTFAATNIAPTYADCKGSVTTSAEVSVRGVCWSTNQNPTIADRKTTNGTGSGTFLGTLTGLNPSTTYYARAYATTVAGTHYGNEISFTTLALVMTPGAIDYSFNTGSSFDNIIFSIQEQSDGKIIFGGAFTYYNGVAQGRIARLNTDGSLDSSFNTGIGFDDEVHAVAVQADGKILVAGYFDSYNGTPGKGLVRLNTNGSIDASFNATILPTATDVALQPDGKILIAQYGPGDLSRLKPDGSLDPSFSSPVLESVPLSIALQANGKIIVGMSNGSKGIIRLNTDGTKDDSFSIGTGFGISGSIVNSVKIQADGKILAGGYFTQYNGLPCNGICRLNTDGTIDNTFNIGTGIGQSGGSAAWSMAIQADNKILLGGAFESFNSQAYYNMVRLNPDGSTDGTFTTGATFTGPVFAISVLQNGKIISGGRVKTPPQSFLSIYGKCLYGN